MSHVRSVSATLWPTPPCWFYVAKQRPCGCSLGTLGEEGKCYVSRIRAQWARLKNGKVERRAPGSGGVMDGDVDGSLFGRTDMCEVRTICRRHRV